MDIFNPYALTLKNKYNIAIAFINRFLHLTASQQSPEALWNNLLIDYRWLAEPYLLKVCEVDKLREENKILRAQLSLSTLQKQPPPPLSPTPPPPPTATASKPTPAPLLSTPTQQPPPLTGLAKFMATGGKSKDKELAQEMDKVAEVLGNARKYPNVISTPKPADIAYHNSLPPTPSSFSDFIAKRFNSPIKPASPTFTFTPPRPPHYNYHHNYNNYHR